MDIPPQLLQYRYHFAIAISVSVILSLFLYAAPRFGSILAYFWPLFASTTLFVVAIVILSGVSLLAVEDHGEKAGEDIVDYVAGQPEQSGTTANHDQDRQISE